MWFILPPHVVAIGDFVSLKSGGPRMRLREVNGQVATCSWWTEEGLQRRDFHLEWLKPWSEEGE